MNVMAAGYREIRCRNEQCKRVRRGLDPVIMVEAKPGSEVRIQCRECKTWYEFRVPVAC